MGKKGPDHCPNPVSKWVLCFSDRSTGFVGTHVSSALKRRGDGVLGLDNFNDYYDPTLKRARQALVERSGVFIVEGDINNVSLLKKLFEVVPLTHVMPFGSSSWG